MVQDELSNTWLLSGNIVNARTAADGFFKVRAVHQRSVSAGARVGSAGESGDGRKRFAGCAGVRSASAGNR